ncbi:uncharacterized protein LOC111629038 [Centruroides sculpturatus]|uniref:uncharacterized protein LOC111629038 n=1 Tax=Centruroides sculpturatus TaxID=218467 RepID=UPI000C6E762B|nr:uncharacterized protein LOC111629038 [Centruroides sculpturatus]
MNNKMRKGKSGFENFMKFFRKNRKTADSKAPEIIKSAKKSTEYITSHSGKVTDKKNFNEVSEGKSYKVIKQPEKFTIDEKTILNTTSFSKNEKLTPTLIDDRINYPKEVTENKVTETTTDLVDFQNSLSKITEITLANILNRYNKVPSDFHIIQEIYEKIKDVLNSRLQEDPNSKTFEDFYNLMADDEIMETVQRVADDIMRDRMIQNGETINRFEMVEKVNEALCEKQIMHERSITVTPELEKERAMIKYQTYLIPQEEMDVKVSACERSKTVANKQLSFPKFTSEERNDSLRLNNQFSTVTNIIPEGNLIASESDEKALCNEKLNPTRHSLIENGEIFVSGANLNPDLQSLKTNKEKSFIPLVDIVVKPTFENDKEVISAENVFSDPSLGALQNKESFVSRANITLSHKHVEMPENKYDESKENNKLKYNGKGHSVSNEGELYSTTGHHKTLMSQDETNFNVKTVSKSEIANEKRSLNSPYNKKYISVANINLRPTSAQESDKKDEEIVNKNEDNCRNYYGRSTLSEFQIAETKQKSNTKTKSTPSQLNKSTVVLVNDMSEKQFYSIRNRQEESLITTDTAAESINDTDYKIHTNEGYNTKLRISVLPTNQVKKDIFDNKNELEKKENENVEEPYNEPISFQFPYCKSELSNVMKLDDIEKACVDTNKESSVSSTLKEKKETSLTSDTTKLSSNRHFPSQNVKIRQNLVCAKLMFPLKKTQNGERKFDCKDLIQCSTSFHQSDQSRYQFKERHYSSNEENRDTKNFGKIKNISHCTSYPLKKCSGEIITSADMNRDIRLQQKEISKDWRLHSETNIKQRASHDSKNTALCTNTLSQTDNSKEVTSSHRNYEKIKTAQTLTQSNINQNNTSLPHCKENPCTSIGSSTITVEASSPSKNASFAVLASSTALNLMENVIVENIDYKQANLDLQSAISHDYVRCENVIFATSCYPENLPVNVSATETLNSSITMQNEQCYRSCNIQPFETVVEVYSSPRLPEEGNFHKMETTLNAVTVSPKEVHQCLRATVAKEWKTNPILQPEIYALCQERIDIATRQSSLYISKLKNLGNISKNDLIVVTEDLPNHHRNYSENNGIINEKVHTFEIQEAYKKHPDNNNYYFRGGFHADSRMKLERNCELYLEPADEIHEVSSNNEKNKLKNLQTSSRVQNSKTHSHINNKDMIFNKMSKRKKERKINSIGTDETKLKVSPKLCDFEVSAGKKNLEVDTLEVVPMERNREQFDLEKRNSKWLPYMARKNNNWCNVAIQTDENDPKLKYSRNVKQEITERGKFQNMPKKIEDNFDFELNKRKIKSKHQNVKNDQIKIKKLKSSRKHDNFENSKNFLYPILNIGMKFLENLENSDK